MKKNELVLAGSIVGAVFLLLVVVLILIEGNNPSHDQVVQRVVEELEGDISSLIVQPTTRSPERIDVYVDRSYSMQYYLTAQTSTYRKLLEALRTDLSGTSRFYGFGFPTKNSSQEVEPIEVAKLFDKDTYRYLNNNYAHLFQEFNRAAPARLVITDGVQSDPESQAQYVGITREIDDWLSRGYVFAVLLYRTPYQGRYPAQADPQHPDLAVDYDCPDRPLVIFAFFASLNALNYVLDVLGPNLQPKHIVRMGGGDIEITLAERIFTEDRRRSRVVFRQSRRHVMRNYRDYFSAQLLDDAADENGFIPLQFDVRFPADAHPWAALHLDSVRKVFQQLEPTLQAWRIVPERVLKRDSTAAAIDPVDLFARPERTTLTITQAGDSADTWQARIQYLVQDPGESGDRDYAWALTLRPHPSTARQFVPGDFSTLDDRQPSACNQVLNLQPLLTSLVRDYYIPGRVVFTTESR